CSPASGLPAPWSASRDEPNGSGAGPPEQAASALAARMIDSPTCCRTIRDLQSSPGLDLPIGRSTQPFQGHSLWPARANSRAVETCGVLAYFVRGGTGFFGPRLVRVNTGSRTWMA